MGMTKEGREDLELEKGKRRRKRKRERDLIGPICIKLYKHFNLF